MVLKSSELDVLMVVLYVVWYKEQRHYFSPSFASMVDASCKIMIDTQIFDVLYQSFAIYNAKPTDLFTFALPVGANVLKYNSDLVC